MNALDQPIPRHALVTGGGSGIGAAIAARLAAEGCRLTLAGRRTDVLAATAATLPGCGYVGMDMTDAASVAAGFAEARAAAGPIDILVCNAGMAESGKFERQDFATWRRIMATNLDALWHCTSAAMPDLRASSAGKIIVVASTAGLKGYAYSVAYSAAKHGAIGFVRALALELAATNITVNAVCPGFTETDIVRTAVATLVAKTGRSESEAVAELAKFNPQGRLIDPDEVAAAVSWLCDLASRSITGQSIVVAGGEVM